MENKISHYMRSPYGAPNGLQVTDEGRWVVDQLTDRIALLALESPHEYGVSRILRELPTESSNTSGVSFGEGGLWLAANGPANRWRFPKKSDAPPDRGEILKVDILTGQTLLRQPLPAHGGTHGLEYDFVETGTIWLSTLQDKTLTQVQIKDWSVKRVIPLPYEGGHGVVRNEDDSLWMVFKTERTIAKMSIDNGKVLDKILIEPGQPEPHGLARCGKDLLYCDATTGVLARIERVFV